MRRLSLSTLLAAVNVGLLLLAVAGVAFAAVQLLRQLADDQALARVAQAGASARNAVGRAGDDLAATALLLSERPTLQRLLAARDTGSLTTFLTQFQQTSRLDAAVVLLDDQPVAASGLPLPWAALTAAHRAATGYFFDTQSGSGALLMGARAESATPPGTSVIVVVLLNDAFARQISAEIGLPVSFIPLPAGESDPGNELRARAVIGDTVTSARIESPARYAAVVPLHAPAGGIAGVVETELSAATVTASVDALIRNLSGLTLMVALAAGLVNLWLGQRLGRPLQRLTAAAARIGGGDLNTPVARAASAEMGTLAATLEEMRRQLLLLTADLQRQQAESDAILTGIIEGVFTVDRERRIQYLNPQTASLLGLRPEDALGRFCGDVLNPQGPDGVRPCAEHCPIVHARFQAGARATEQLQPDGGPPRTVVITSAPPMGEADQRQVQVLRDETEVEATRRLRDAVLANISHEFRTPLSAQLASIELLLDQLPALPADQVRELVGSLQRGTLRLTQLIDNLLESVRIEAGQRGLRRQPVDLADVVRQALELTRPLLDQRQQSVRQRLPGPLPEVTGDAPRLTQVFVNLLANASKFAPAGSAITIGGALEPAALTLWVEDEGPGLPDLPEQSLFTRFVRSAEAEPEAGGVGLGLWIVKSIVERHGGRVTALNREKGARLCVTLPRSAADENSGG